MNSKITTIRTGGFELIDSGIFQILSKELTTLIFGNITINFEFEIDEKSTESIIKVETTQPNTIKFILININNSTYGTTDFIQFGKENDGTDVYISFKVNSLNNRNVRSLEYSIFKKNA